MIDVLTVRASNAVTSGDVVKRLGIISLDAPPTWPESVVGQVEYTLIEPASMVQWISAEFVGVEDQSTDAVRVRFVDADGDSFYLDESDFKFKAVADTTSWDADYSRPAVMACLDLWTRQSLQIVVGLVSTENFPRPQVGDLKVALDLPTWEGAAAQAARRVAEAVDQIEPIVVHMETLTADQSRWLMGNPHSEINMELTELIQAAINGRHKSATLTDGVVELDGPAAKAGDSVRIAVKFKPSTSVRRMGTIRVINETPAWVLSNLITEGGLNGEVSPIGVNGIEVRRRKLDMQITVRGVATRQADALYMRAALQEYFSNGVEVVFDSCRSVQAQVEGLVEVLSGGRQSLPECIGVVRVTMDEYLGYRRVRNARRQVDDGQGGTTTELVTNEIELTIGGIDGTVHLDITAEDFEEGETPCPLGNGC